MPHHGPPSSRVPPLITFNSAADISRDFVDFETCLFSLFEKFHDALLFQKLRMRLLKQGLHPLTRRALCDYTR